ncbi:RDD family protein [Rhizobium sp. A37_96]
MSFAASDHQMATLPPRRLWRRLGAYLIDIVIFQIAFTLLFLAISAVTPWDLTLPSLQKRHCEITTSSGALVDKIEAEWPLQPGETRTNQLCRISWLGSKGYTVLVSEVTSQQGSTTSTRALSVPVNGSGDAIDLNATVRPTSSIVLLLLPLAFALFTANGRRTPGKRLTSLRVITVENDTLPLGLAVKREILKLLPLTLLGVFNLASLLFLRPSMPPLEDLIQQARDASLLSASGFLALTGALAPLLFVFTLVWWIFPLIVWRGQTFYDRLCDTLVVKP